MKFVIQLYSAILYLPLFIYNRMIYRKFGWRSCIKNPSICILGKRYIQIGEYSFISKHARIEAVTRYGSKHYTPNLVIGNHVAINQNFHCTCAQEIFIDDGTSITANCGIFDIIHPYEDIAINPRVADIEIKPVRIGKDCLIGMNSVILPGTELGNHCVVGANSTVSGVFPDYSVIVGSPARIVKYYDKILQEWVKVS